MPPISFPSADAPPSSEKAIRCVFCHRSFSRLEHRKRHERIHTNEKPFRCLKCPRSFTRSDLLVRHKRFSHANVNGCSQKMVHLAGSSGIQRINTTQRETPEPSQIELAAEISTEEPTGLVETINPLLAQQFQPYLQPLLTNSLVGGLSRAAITTDSSPSQGTMQHCDIFTDTSMGRGADMNMNFSNPFGNPSSVTGNFDTFSMPPFYDQPTFHTMPPLPYYFSAQDFNENGMFHLDHNPGDATEYPDEIENLQSMSSLSQLESRLPFFRLESVPVITSHRLTEPRMFWDVTADDRQKLLAKVESFNSVIPGGFVVPSHHTLSRYLAGYAGGFHDHLPFLHISTIDVKHASPELILAIAAVGGQYCFEGTKAVELFTASKALALERMRRIGAMKSAQLYRKEAWKPSPPQKSSSVIRPMAAQANQEDVMSESDSSASAYISDDSTKLLEISQTLLLLMAMATWSGNKAMYGEALAIQSILATMIREYKLLSQERAAQSASWEDWVRFEGTKRTYFMIYCFFSFHSIIYNTAPAILSMELDMDLPCSETEWKCPTAAAWKDVHRLSTPEPAFREHFHHLFMDNSWQCSSLGSYILMHGLIQHIFLAREVARYRPASAGSLSPQDVSALQQALTNWQHGWERNFESSLDPKNPHGPISLNSTTLLRIAYIRIQLDVGPWRTLETQDPQRIVAAMVHSPAVRRSNSLTQAAWHSAHALSIPIKLGVNLISRNQILTWSLQHSIGSLECALLLSKWLDVVTEQRSKGQVLDEDEQRLLEFVADVLMESDSDRPAMSGSAQGSNLGGFTPSYTRLSARVMQVCARIFCGESVWAVVNVIGRVMYAYGDMLERRCY